MVVSTARMRMCMYLLVSACLRRAAQRALREQTSRLPFSGLRSKLPPMCPAQLSSHFVSVSTHPTSTPPT